MSSDDEEFMIVTLHAVSPAAVLISNTSIASDEAWVPKNKINAMDHSKFTHDHIGTDMEIRIDRAIAYEKDLL